MTRRSGSPREPTPAALTESALLEIGLRVGDRVRFRRTDAGSWKEAVVERRDRDGSVGVRDDRGATRAIAVVRLQVRSKGPRGGAIWEALADRAERDEQLGIW